MISAPDELIDPITHVSAPPILLRPGRSRQEIVQLDLGDADLQVVDFSSPVAMNGRSVAGRVGCLTVVRQAAQGRMNGHALTPGILFAYGESTDLAVASAEGSRYALLSFSADGLEAAARALGFELAVPERGEFRLARTCGWERLHGFLQLLTPAVHTMTEPLSSEHAVVIRDELLGIVVRSLCADHHRTVPLPTARFNPVRIVRACQHHAAQARYQRVTLADLAAASGVSERSVRNAFSDCYGMSPTAYLRVSALNAVHRTLLHGPPRGDAVSRAASDFGFWHLSRFASYYRTLFGHVPSSTLTQSMRVAAP